MRPGYARRRVSDADRVMRSVPEGAFMRQLIEAALWQGWMVFHDMDSRQNEPGFPDLVMVGRVNGPNEGRIIFAEIKREQGRVSREQLVWLGALMQCPGVETVIWRPRDIDAAMATLAKREVE